MEIDTYLFAFAWSGRGTDGPSSLDRISDACRKRNQEQTGKTEVQILGTVREK